MTFPQTPRVLLGELQMDSADWANITSDIYSQRQPVTITRGQPAEGSQSSPSTCTLLLKNPGGRYSPRNPMSPYYGKIGRNTPLRISYGRGAYGLVLRSFANGRGETTADTAGISITGDTDIRVDMEVISGQGSVWSGNFDIASKFLNADASRSWTLRLVAGKLRFNWFTAGTAASVKQAESTVVVGGAATGRRAVRVTIDVDNGAAGNTVTFYTAPDISGPWTVLGAPVVQAGVTSIFDGNAVLRIGANPDTSTWTWVQAAGCAVYSAELRSGIGGTLRANPLFTAQPLDPNPIGSALFFDAQGNGWWPNGDPDVARIWYGDVDVRFHGEISSLPPDWDPSELDATVSIEAAGLLRRLGQGTDPAQTGLKDWVTHDKSALAAYYPLDGGEGTQYSLNLGGTYYLTTRFFAQGIPGQVPVFTYGKDMGPYLGTGMEFDASGSAYMRGDVGTPDPNVALDFVWTVPSNDPQTGFGVLVAHIQDYNNNYWALQLNDSTDSHKAHVTFVAGSVTAYPDSAVIPALADESTQPHHCRFQLTVNGGNTEYAVYVDGQLVDSGTQVGYVQNGCSITRVYYSRYPAQGQGVMNLGHWTVWANAVAAAIPTATEFYQAATGYAGETAGERIERICEVGGIPLEIAGDASETTVMGPQYSESKLTQIRDAEGTDRGILTEPRDGFGLRYIPLRAMIGQLVRLTLDHNAGQLDPPFSPTDDDQLTRNDVTVVRREGGTYRLTKETGALSALDPPFGVGRYRDEVTVNTLTDDQLPGIAAWLVAQGTLDEARFPSVGVNLGMPGIQSAGLEDDCLAVDVGDLITATNLTALSIYSDVVLLVLGYVEEISEGGFKHTIRWNCQPGTLYVGAFYSAAVAGEDRYASAGSSLNAGVTTTATSLSVKTDAGNALWTTTAGEFPFDIDIGGERITVGGISGGSSPQTFSPVTRSVNGVVKAHNADAPVQLWKIPRYAAV
jgi:hypothetical protein